MQTAILSYAADDVSRFGAVTANTANVTKEAEGEVRPFRFFGWSDAWLNPRLPRLLLAAALTAPIRYEFDPYRDSAPYLYSFRLLARFGRPLSISQARDLALSVLANAERNLRQERAEEAKFLASFWNAD